MDCCITTCKEVRSIQSEVWVNHDGLLHWGEVLPWPSSQSSGSRWWTAASRHALRWCPPLAIQSGSTLMDCSISTWRWGPPLAIQSEVFDNHDGLLHLNQDMAPGIVVSSYSTNMSRLVTSASGRTWPKVCSVTRQHHYVEAFDLSFNQDMAPGFVLSPHSTILSRMVTSA